jgi:predicted ATPase
LDRDIFAHAKAPFVQTLAETEIAFARKLVARSDYADAGKWARKAIDLLDNDQEGDHKLAAPILAPLRQTALKLLATALVYSGVLSNLDLAGNAIELAQQVTISS